MYNSLAGSKFLKVYNEKNNSSKTPKEFFEEVFLPVVIGDSISLNFIVNSAFHHPKNKKMSLSDKNKYFIKRIKDKAFGGESFPGLYSSDIKATTSGQRNNVIDLSEDEIYLAWIGDSLSVNINGVYMLFNDGNILYDIYTGWEKYRDMVDDDISNKIPSWNANYLYNLYMNPSLRITKDDVLESKKSFKHINWASIIYGIIKHNGTKSVNLQAFGYFLGQTNSTYGWMVFDLAGIKSVFDIKTKLFGGNEYLSNKYFGLNIFEASKFPVISGRQMKPNTDFRSFEKLGKVKDSEKNDYTECKNCTLAYYLSTFNNKNMELKKINENAIQFAKELKVIGSSSEYKTDRLNAVKKIFEAYSHAQLLKAFINLKEIVGSCDAEKITELYDKYISQFETQQECMSFIKIAQIYF